MSQNEVNFWASGNLAQELSERERELRDLFVDQYLYDYDIRLAAIRMGFVDTVATEYGLKLFNDSYVQKRLAEQQRLIAEDPKAEDEATKRRIRAALIREANYRGIGGSHSARVSALAQLKSIYGMDAPTRIQAEMKHQGGVMAVPAIADLDAWQKAAEASQQALVSDTENG